MRRKPSTFLLERSEAKSASAPVRRHPMRTRRRILQAAIRLFASHGFDGMSVNRIAEQARVNKRMVYHYFGSKKTLFDAAIGEVYKRIDAVEFHAVERGRSQREKLSRLLESYFDFLEAEPQFARLLQRVNLQNGAHPARQNHLFSKNPFLERFRAIVNEGIAASEFRSNIDVTHLLIHFIGLCFIYHSNRFSLSQGIGMDLGDANVKERGLIESLRLVFEGIAISRPAAGEIGGTSIQTRPDLLQAQELSQS